MVDGNLPQQKCDDSEGDVLVKLKPYSKFLRKDKTVV